MKNYTIKCKNLLISNKKPLTLIAGPCQLESEQHAIEMVRKIKKITSKLKINFIYKTSFDKANRTSLKSKRGIGLEKSLKIFQKIKKKFNVPILTDVHTVEQCKIISNFGSVTWGCIWRHLEAMLGYVGESRS